MYTLIDTVVVGGGQAGLSVSWHLKQAGRDHVEQPHLTWLRAFEASARHLSFTHAAQELNWTCPIFVPPQVLV